MDKKEKRNKSEKKSELNTKTTELKNSKLKTPRKNSSNSLDSKSSKNSIKDISKENKKLEKSNSDYFSDTKLSSFPLNSKLIETLNSLGYITATKIQSESIPQALESKDVIGQAKTGSGKSLAFLIPAAQLILTTKIKEGILVLIITPTRELAIQLYDLTKDILIDNGNLCTLVIGGGNRKKESEKISSSNMKIVIATPGRLLDHMENTKNFNYSNLKMLIIDEADKILKIGFEEELKQIINKIPKDRQTLLFSATITPKVEDIITLSMKNYENIRIKTSNDDPTVSSLEQGYIKITADKKFLFLFTFIKKNPNKKIIIFFSTCKEVEFFSTLLNYVDCPVLSLTGDYKQQKRSSTFLEFCSLQKGILLCTDVAQRGLDIPDIDWVIQYDPPHDSEEYLHRVGRTARGAFKSGKALIMILPNEIGFIRLLKVYKIKIEEFDFEESKLAKVQEQLEKLVNRKDKYLYNLAVEAYRAYIHAYNAQVNKEVFNLEKLDLMMLCKSFGLVSPPFVHLNVRHTTSSMRRKNKRFIGGNQDDKRQFVK